MTLHRCTDAECPYSSLQSPEWCVCHKTDEQVLTEQRDCLLEAVGIFLNKDARFQVMVGGNPNAVDEMIEHVAAVYAKAGGAS